MINNFKKPDLNAPRYRQKRLGLLNEETYREFKDKKPLYSEIDNKKLKATNGEIKNEEFMIFSFINYVNSLAKIDNGKLIKIVGNHELMNYGNWLVDFLYYKNDIFKPDISNYCRTRELPREYYYKGGIKEYSSEFAIYNDEKKGGRCKRFAPGGDINKEIVKDNIYGIIIIKNSKKNFFYVIKYKNNIKK